MRTLSLQHGPWRAEVVPDKGGRMVGLSFGDADVLEPVVNWHPPGRAWPAAGLYPLVPFSNRIEHGRLNAGHREVRLKIHPFAAPHAVHGPAHRRAWSVASAAPHEVSLVLDSPADEDWPFAFEASLVYALGDDALTCRIGLVNRSDETMPAGIGLHPFFHAPNGTRYTFAYRDRWPQTEADAPVPLLSEDLTRVDTTASEEGLIACLGRWDGTATVTRPDLAIHVEASANLTHLVLYRAAGSGFLCLEPVSHATDGFNHHAAGHPHTGAVFLAPGGSLEGSMTIRCTRPGTTP